ncbi:acyltransferase family protein [Hyphobacterium marinum]|uniref:Acyltransferase n=1 Tax=Hyphobacterium marinum TaxID=3116574 RepID=A0ABU7LX02_9PROT|nr:acyltransferase [Hyphobacterium sp. Y6023]MEE2566091.1 acyltransferase [Hyphobacterium sp. Y6023]
MGSARHNIDALDGLRGLAALMVMVSHMSGFGHFFEARGTGQNGVMLFFVLSGFLMAYLYCGDKRTDNEWTDYAFRRVFRVYPLYFAVVTGVILFSLAGSSHFFGQITLADYWHLVTLRSGFSVFWTIPVEMKFYLVLPVVIVLARLFRPGPDRLLLFMAFLVFAFAIYRVPENTSLLRGIPFFAAGMLAGVLHRHLGTIAGDARWLRILATVLTPLLLLAGFFTLPPLSAVTGWVNPIWYAPVLFAGLYAALTLGVANAAGPVAWIFSNPISRYVGQISFAVYLLHMPVLAAVSRLDVAPPAAFALDVVLVIGLASAAHFVIERPMRNVGYALSARFR